MTREICIAAVLLTNLLAVQTLHAQDRVRIRVGYLPASHDVLLFIAKDNGLFPPELEVELVAYKNSGDILRELAAERIDIGIPGIAAPVNFIAGGHKFTIIGGAAAESAAVVVPVKDAKRFLGKPFPEKIRAFRGLKIGTVRQSTGDALFRKAIRDAGMIDAVDIREYSDPNALLAELRNQYINAAVLWSPHMSRAEAGEPPMKIVLWLGEVLTNHVCCRQVVRDSFMQTQRRAVVLYLAGIIRAMRFYRDPTNRQAIVQTAANWVKGTPPDILEKELFLPDADHNHATRTTLSVDLNQEGIRRYVEAMKDTSGFDRPKVQEILSKVDPTAMRDAYIYLGIPAREAEDCVTNGYDRCPLEKKKKIKTK